MGRLEGKVALVTGSAAGIGQAIAWRYAREGAQVLATDISSEMDETVAQGEGRIVAAHCDVTDPKSIQSCVAQCIDRFGGIDVMCNNAGFPAPLVPVDELRFEDWKRSYSVNVDGVFHGIQAAAPHMKEKGGAIINMASIGSVKALPNLAAYASSKAAVMQLTKVAALDLGKYGIRVNAIGPGYIRTTFGGGYSDEVAEMLAEQNPMGRIGEPDDVAGVALFLASDDARWVNGAMHFVCGGSSAL
ncbi:SDR family NAD(P)-dependent oxidoreductase [Novosphingobium pentaromativorans]|uniref:Short-chain dehydrogenase/reductase SDR n=1 Tax=Novosphingobium pentaromativorans US6-1 TaxID=1088721 RepID=G6EGE4_9SPHN|nr:SDR family oxidoreductase [Novosphingobium pentaromativorans]AIT82130.1 hypothetical protein JI59_21615 [Novosphingobium pentaromativorans US6-1]EHJ59595.1 hypothetical protein NSU_3478 [Novosphingobium pentaromativorans US6-1]